MELEQFKDSNIIFIKRIDKYDFDFNSKNIKYRIKI